MYVHLLGWIRETSKINVHIYFSGIIRFPLSKILVNMVKFLLCKDKSRFGMK